jgi:hypothetical protein
MLLALYQTAWFVFVHYLAFDMPGGWLEAGLVYVTLTLSTLAGMMLGLFASSLAPNSNSASLLVIVMMIPQIVLGGALIALPGPGLYVSAFTTTRWAFEALMSITGVGSDVAADVCWDLDEDLRDAMTLEMKDEQGCRCLGTAIFSQCQFPGVRGSYNAAVDAPPPVHPGDPPVRPVEPELPPEPQEPENQADQIAMAEYLDALEVWQEEVDVIQSDYQAQLDVYQDELEDYQDARADYERENGEWKADRASAVVPAETLIERMDRDFGWTFVNKEDPAVYYGKIFQTWIAQGIYSTVLFVTILFLQKRKDVI